ncbi:tetratricopeptide repeat-containing sensor histidine kinase [Psychroserpens ponticola]|uniref:histidine kinase n=1 Tax=Psychroserpens ponticola TaxID=2932268 RepID=A0ABY7RZP8_9FLAO|nr:tetratricopeptide repeat-containing sensor histidine kinase [Psychroserpens ponticola]WCO02636.1 tetratricopeptide repeat protein [Psychroserpens ponticola]
MIKVKFIVFIFCFQLITPLINAQSVKEINELNTLFETTIFYNLKGAQELASQAVQKSEVLQDEELLLSSYTNLSLIYFRQKQNDSSLVYAQKAFDLSIKLQDFQKQAILYNRIGAVERRKGNYSESHKHFEKGYQIAKDKNYVEQMCSIHINLAWLYRIRGDENKFLEELENSIKLSKANNLKIRLGDSYNLKGISLFTKNRDSSIYYYKKAIDLFKETRQRHYEGLVYANLGDVYLNAGQYDLALESLELCESIALEVNNMASLYYVNLSLGIYNYNLDDFSKCVSKYEKAINEYGKYVDENAISLGYWYLSEGYYFNKQFKKAFDVQEQYIELNERLLNAQKTKEFDEIRTKYEVEKKDSQIELLEKEKELSEAKRKSILIGGILITVALSLLLLYYRNRIKTQRIIREQEREHAKKEQEIVQVKALIEGQDKERHRIAKELHDGLGGQLASVNLTLSEVNSELQNPSINNISEKVSDIFRDLRVLSHNLSANYFDEKVFDELLVELKQQYESLNAFEITISIFPEQCLNDLDVDLRHNLYRIFQELFNNALKHSNCNAVELSINKHNDSIIVIFEDDGIGFDRYLDKEGIGLANINERSKSINGQLVIDSQKGKGTQVTLEIPI